MDWRFWSRRSKERDLDDEIAYDLAAETEERAASGMPRDRAERESRRDFGNAGLVKEDIRAAWGWNALERLAQDIRYALRQFARSPGFAAVAVLSLALGIGVNTAIFSLVNIVMLKSLPVRHPEELARVGIVGAPTTGKGSSWQQPLWEQLRDRQDVFDGIFAYGSTGGVDLNNGGEVRPISVGLVTGGFFTTLGVAPAAGRLLTDSDDRRGCSAVAVITHAFWQSEYGGRRDIVGRTVALNGRTFEIVGVAEPGFFGIEFGYPLPVWISHCPLPMIRGGTSGFQAGTVIGRVKPGITMDQARGRLAAVAPAIFEAAVPGRPGTFSVLPFAQGLPALRYTYGDALAILMAVVGVVLLAMCANLANLMLARGAARQREIAVRLAIGAGRGRLMRQLLTESLLLSLAGAVLGMLFAGWASRVLVAMLTRPDRVVLDLAPDWRVMAFSITVGVLAGALFGVAPSWKAVRVDLHVAMKPLGRGQPGLTRWDMGKALVALQVALSLALVAGAGLLLVSWRSAAMLDPGFRPEGVLIAEVNGRPLGLPPAQRPVFYNNLLDRLRAIPGVSAVSVSARTPFSDQTMALEVSAPDTSNGAHTMARFNLVGGGYFRTLRTRLIAGRDFHSGDAVTAPPVAIVNEELAKKLFGRSQVVGERIRTRFRDPYPIAEIVGVAADTKEFSLREDNQPLVYLPLSQDPVPGVGFAFALRFPGRPAALIPVVKDAIAGVDPRISLNLRLLSARVEDTLRLPRTLGVLSAVFGAMALLLASIGLYGTMSYAIDRRRGEIGVRIALGATRPRVVAMVLGEALRIVSAGIVAGVALSLAGGRLLSRFLFGVAPNDLATLTVAALVLATVAIAAAGLPAFRAARLDPMAALREE